MNVLLAVDQSRNSSAATKFVERFWLPDSSKLYLLFVEELQGKCQDKIISPVCLGT